MATAPTPVMPPPANPPVGTTPFPAPDDFRRFTVDEYERMARAGILEDEPVELIDGILVCKMPQNPQHAKVVRLIHRVLSGAVPVGWSVFKEDPIRIPEFSEPKPDIAIVRMDPNDYQDRHPGPGDVALVIEVADSSLPRDRTVKLAIYAGSGFAEYWIVNLADEQIEIYTDPDQQQRSYCSRQIFGKDQAITLKIEGQELGLIRVADLLP